MLHYVNGKINETEMSGHYRKRCQCFENFKTHSSNARPDVVAIFDEFLLIKTGKMDSG